MFRSRQIVADARQRYWIVLRFDGKISLHNFVVITCLHFYNEGLSVNYKMILPKKGARAQLRKSPLPPSLRRLLLLRQLRESPSLWRVLWWSNLQTWLWHHRRSRGDRYFCFLSHSRGRRDAAKHGRSYHYQRGAS